MSAIAERMIIVKDPDRSAEIWLQIYPCNGKFLSSQKNLREMCLHTSLNVLKALLSRKPA